MKTLRRIATVVAVIYAMLVAALYVGQRRFLYPVPLVLVPQLAGGSLIRAETRDGQPVVVLYVPAQAGQMTVVHFHGNGDQLATTTFIGSALAARGLGFFGVEYPGYGLASNGTTTEQNVYAVADAALAYLHDQLHVPASQIVLQGHSLGSGVAAEMATRGHGARLVLLAPYTSMTDVASRLMPAFPAHWLLRDRYDTLGKTARLTLPVLVLCGSLDKLVPPAMSRTLAAALPNVQVLEDGGAGHNDLFDSAGYAACVLAFARGERCAPEDRR